MNQCQHCEHWLYKETIGMGYCNRPNGYKLLTVLERGFVDTHDLPEKYELCGEDGKFYHHRRDGV